MNRNLQKIGEKIEAESERQVIERLGYRPSTWYYGGSSHNDYRLRVAADDDDSDKLRITDGNAIEEYPGTDDDISDFVSDWLDLTMPDDADGADD